MIGDSYAPKPGQRVILHMKPDGPHPGDHVQGTVISVVSWADCDGECAGDECGCDPRLRVRLRTSWGDVTVPLDRVQQVTHLDALEAMQDAQRRRTRTFAEWVARQPQIDVELVRGPLASSRDGACGRRDFDEEFEREKADMLLRRVMGGSA